MSEIKDGGPAFPLAHSHTDLTHTNWSHVNGMTLRDYFAAKAMAALIAEPLQPGASGMTVWLTDEQFEDGQSPGSRMARAAYVMADAMIRARGQS